MRHVAPQFQARLHALGDHPLVGEARGVGLIGAIELVADKNDQASFEPPTSRRRVRCVSPKTKGLIVRPLIGDRIALCPPLVISEAEIDELFDRLARARQDARLGYARADRAVVIRDRAA